MGRGVLREASMSAKVCIGWHTDVTQNGGGAPDGTVDSYDPWYYAAYDEGWRMVAVFRGADTTPKEFFVNHAAGLSGFGGSSALDAVILRDRDANTTWTSSTDGALEERVYYAQNWRGDVVNVLKYVSGGGGVQQSEAVRYSSYGVPFGFSAGDFDASGVVDVTDSGMIVNWINNNLYDVRGDLDLDGDVDPTD